MLKTVWLNVMNQGYADPQEARDINKQVLKHLRGKKYDCKMQLQKPRARYITRQRETSSQPETERRQDVSTS